MPEMNEYQERLKYIIEATEVGMFDKLKKLNIGHIISEEDYAALDEVYEIYENTDLNEVDFIKACGIATEITIRLTEKINALPR